MKQGMSESIERWSRESDFPEGLLLVSFTDHDSDVSDIFFVGAGFMLKPSCTQLYSC